ncbi:hypothetical protein D1F64_07530 [Breoghania sp. L-A4]|nr:hypothetical protein D1F64_07530 [Breoghania sp. L-A4]
MRGQDMRGALGWARGEPPEAVVTRQLWRGHQARWRMDRGRIERRQFEQMQSSGPRGPGAIAAFQKVSTR